MVEKLFADECMAAKSSLVSRNITILGRRTSVRLEPEMWMAMKSIAKREGCSIHELCSLISLRKRDNTSLTAAIRVFIMLYFKASSTEEGHARAGHGDFESMKARARITVNDAPVFFRTNRPITDADERRVMSN
ncbi:MAG: hypothetical protein CMH27_08910 [Micavibrio sp.]|nr:hypothetical protein [Micavibrio sp.]|tara:strand:- start:2134 stop:2535 length:402 start_codon:yes stop_codon:yes gene_type:complete